MKFALRPISLATMGLGLMLTSTAAFSESLSDALKWAYQDNPSLNAARANIRVGAENVHIQNSARRPKVNFSANYQNQNAEIYSGNWQQNDQVAATISASLLLFDSGKTDLAVQSAIAASKAQQYQLLANEQQVLLATVRAYLDVLRDRDLVASARNNIKTLEASLSSARVAYDAGSATVTELAQTEAGLAQGRAALANVLANLERSEASYEVMTGRKPGQLAEIPSLSDLPKSMDAAVEHAKQSSPLVKASHELERAALYDLRRAERGRYPSVSASASSTLNNALDGSDPTQVDQLGLSVNVPLYNGGQISALKRQAESLLEARANETRQTMSNLVQNVANAWAYLENSQSIVSANQQVVEAQELANQSSAVEFEFGASTVVDRLDTEQALMSARANLTSARYEQQFASYQLVAAMGALTIDKMGLKIPNINPLEPAKAVEQKSETEQKVEQISDRWSQ